MPLSTTAQEHEGANTMSYPDILDTQSELANRAAGLILKSTYPSHRENTGEIVFFDQNRKTGERNSTAIFTQLPQGFGLRHVFDNQGQGFFLALSKLGFSDKTTFVGKYPEQDLKNHPILSIGTDVIERLEGEEVVTYVLNGGMMVEQSRTPVKEYRGGKILDIDSLRKKVEGLKTGIINLSEGVAPSMIHSRTVVTRRTATGKMGILD